MKLAITRTIESARVGLYLTILYDFIPSDRGVPYYRDGSGCAPTGAEVLPYQVIVHSVDFGDYVKNRSEIDSGWLEVLEKYAWTLIDKLNTPGTGLWFDMVENAETND